MPGTGSFFITERRTYVAYPFSLHKFRSRPRAAPVGAGAAAGRVRDAADRHVGAGAQPAARGPARAAARDRRLGRRRRAGREAAGARRGAGLSRAATAGPDGRRRGAAAHRGRPRRHRPRGAGGGGGAAGARGAGPRALPDARLRHVRPPGRGVHLLARDARRGRGAQLVVRHLPAAVRAGGGIVGAGGAGARTTMCASSRSPTAAMSCASGCWSCGTRSCSG